MPARRSYAVILLSILLICVGAIVVLNLNFSGMMVILGVLAMADGFLFAFER